MTAHYDAHNSHGKFEPPYAGNRPCGTLRYAARHKNEVTRITADAAINTHDKIKMHGGLDIALFVKTNCHIYHALIKHLDLGLNTARSHLFAEILYHILGIYENIVAAKVAGSAVKRCHFRHKGDRLQALIIAHTNGAAGGRLNNDIRAFGFYCVHAGFKASSALGGGAIILANMKMDYGRAG